MPRLQLTIGDQTFRFRLQCDECWEREEAEVHERRVRELLDRSGVPQRMRAWTLASHPQSTVYAPSVEAWLRDYALGERRNLLLFGPVGTGKSGLAWAVLRLLIEQGEPGLYVSFRELLWELRRSFRSGEPASTEQAQKVPALVLDDLGSERPTDFARDELAVLVERRYSRGLPLIVTSNFDPEQLARRLGHDDEVVGRRIVSRLADGAVQLRLSGRDQRLSA
jgi:DNA replication protein DnaC